MGSRVIRAALIALAIAACGAHPTAPVGPHGSGSEVAPAAGGSEEAGSDAPVLVDGSHARAHLGHRVVVKGTARDAKIGPAIETGDLFVYCLGVDRWPPDVSGWPVAARGTLEQTNEFAAHTSPTGEVSAGASGPVWVLRDCAYERAP